MKNIALILVAIVLVSSIAISGDMAKSGQWGVNTSLSTSTAGIGFKSAGFKFMTSENMAVRAFVGFASNSIPAAGNTPSYTQSGYGFGAGFEYHMTAIGGVSPYLGLQAGYSGESVGNPANLAVAPPNATAFQVTGVYGGEYFFSSNFSFAGEVGIGFTSSGVSGAMNSSFGTASANFICAWYLN